MSTQRLAARGLRVAAALDVWSKRGFLSNSQEVAGAMSKTVRELVEALKQEANP